MFSDITNFIRQVFNSPKEFIPLHPPCFVGNEKEYLCDCIDSTYVSSVGKYVDRFENMIKEYTKADGAVVCVNGTNALHLALVLAGVKAGDEVITQPLTFISTANSIVYTGACPVFIDVDMDTMGLSPSKMKAWLQENAEVRNGECINIKTGRVVRACLPMHTFGHPVHLDELSAVCLEYCIELVEDAAESLGSFYKGKHTGILGKVGILSFNGNKTITTGGGGMLLFNDKNLADYAKHLTTQAKLPHPWEYAHDGIGYNYRMPNINAALGCAQMEHLPEFIENKRELALIYDNFFKGSEVSFFVEPPDCLSNYWLNAIVFETRQERDGFLSYSHDQGVMTRPIWQLMNKLPMYKDCECGDLSNAAWLEDRVVNIPSGVRL